MLQLLSHMQKSQMQTFGNCMWFWLPKRGSAEVAFHWVSQILQNIYLATLLSSLSLETPSSPKLFTALYLPKR